MKNTQHKLSDDGLPKRSMRRPKADHLRLRTKIDSMLNYIELIRYCDDRGSQGTILRLVSQRLAYLLHLSSIEKITEQKHSIRLGGLRIAFSVLEQLHSFLEIFVDNDYELCSGFEPHPEWVVIDAGANIGLFSLYAAQTCSKVYAFEPDPRAFEHLRENIRSNDLGNKVKLIPQALSSSIGKGNISRSSRITANSIVRDLPSHTSTNESDLPVDVTTLDTFFRQERLDQINLIKMDVEGSEAKALKGGTYALTRTQRVVMEYHNYLVPDVLAEVRTLLSEAGLREVCRIDHKPDVMGLVYFARMK